MRPNYYQREWLVPVPEEMKFSGLMAQLALSIPEYTRVKTKRYIRREFWIEQEEYSAVPLCGREKEIALTGYLRGRGFDVLDANFVGMSDKLEAETFLVFVNEKSKFKSEGRMEMLHKRVAE